MQPNKREESSLVEAQYSTQVACNMSFTNESLSQQVTDAYCTCADCFLVCRWSTKRFDAECSAVETSNAYLASEDHDHC